LLVQLKFITTYSMFINIDPKFNRNKIRPDLRSYIPGHF
jgi:hypothetical protein